MESETKTMGESNAVSIRPAAPRAFVQARLSDGRIFEALPGTLLANILREACVGASSAPMAAIVNGRLRELTAALDADSDVVPLTMSDSDGMRIYRRSVNFLMLTAMAEVFPEADVFIEHSATTAGAYFCEIRGRNPFTQEELARVEARMHEIAAEDAPIVQMNVPVQEAIAMFRERGEEDKAQLISFREKETIPLYSLRGRRDYLQGFMVPSSGCLRCFALHAYPRDLCCNFRDTDTPHPSILSFPTRSFLACLRSRELAGSVGDSQYRGFE